MGILFARELSLGPDDVDGFPDVTEAKSQQLARGDGAEKGGAAAPACAMQVRELVSAWVAAYLTCKIFRPSLTSSGKSFTSFRFCAGRMTVLTPARSAPMSFSLMPPTGSTRPRSEISPCSCTSHLVLARSESGKGETHVRSVSVGSGENKREIRRTSRLSSYTR